MESRNTPRLPAPDLANASAKARGYNPSFSLDGDPDFTDAMNAARKERYFRNGFPRMN